MLCRSRRKKPIDVAVEYIKLNQDQDGFAKEYMSDFIGDFAKLSLLLNN